MSGVPRSTHDGVPAAYSLTSGIGSSFDSGWPRNSSSTTVFKGGRVVKTRHLIPAAIAALALAAAIVALPAAAGAGTLTKTKNVGVGDDFYAPTKVQLAKGGTVKWTWASANGHP